MKPALSLWTSRISVDQYVKLSPRIAKLNPSWPLLFRRLVVSGGGLTNDWYSQTHNASEGYSRTMERYHLDIRSSPDLSESVITQSITAAFTSPRAAKLYQTLPICADRCGFASLAVITTTLIANVRPKLMICGSVQDFAPMHSDTRKPASERGALRTLLEPLKSTGTARVISAAG